MSREFRVWLNTTVPTRQMAHEVEDAFEGLWPMHESHVEEPDPGRPGGIRVSLRGDGSLSGGKHSYVLAREFQTAIWRRLQRYVDVSVSFTSLEPEDTIISTVQEFEHARDGGLLHKHCRDCDDELGFATESDLCATCGRLAEMERMNGQ